MSVAFEPRRPVGSTSTAEPLGVLAIVAILLVVAVGKPWARAETRSASVAVVPSGAPAAAEGRPVLESRPAATPVMPARLPAATSVAPLLVARDRWGVRLVVEPARSPVRPWGDRSGGALAELWEPTALPLPGRSNERITFAPAPATVRLIEVTTPAGVTVERVQVTVSRPLGRAWPVRLRRLDIASGRFSTLFAPRAGRDLVTPWTPGVYELEVDLGGKLDGVSTRLTLVILGS